MRNPIAGTEAHEYALEHGAFELADRMAEIAADLADLDEGERATIAGVPVIRTHSGGNFWHGWPGEWWALTWTLPEAAEYLAERERGLAAETVNIPER